MRIPSTIPRFKSSKQAGAHFGLTPKKYQSGKTDRSGGISLGDGIEWFFIGEHA